MSVRVELVDPLDVLDEAASVLQEAWAPPCIVYDTPYLEWQFKFPSRLTRVAVVARSSAGVVGFAGTTSRVVEMGSWTGDVAVVSFVAVRSAWRGQRIADRLYDELLGDLQARPTPVVTFAEPGSVGERVLFTAYERAGFQRHELGPCEPFGCAAREASPRARIVSPLDLTAAAGLSSAGVRLSANPEQLRHFAADPRWRCAVTVDSSDQSAAAMAVAAPMKTAKGQETVLAIDVAFAPVDAVDSLRDAADAVAAAYHAKPGSMVFFHNAPIRDTPRAKEVGLRKLPARYSAHLCLPRGLGHLAESNSRGTNIDVV